MNQLTLRGLDKDLELQLRRLARKERTSLNKAALRMLRRGAGIDSTAIDDSAAELDVIGDRLDDFIGSWSAAQAASFDEAVAVFEEIDAEQWR